MSNTEQIPSAEDFMNSFPFGKKLSTQDLMIEFAKLHVEAALKAAAIEAPMHVTKEILSSYPLNNIK